MFKKPLLSIALSLAGLFVSCSSLAAQPPSFPAYCFDTGYLTAASIKGNTATLKNNWGPYVGTFQKAGNFTIIGDGRTMFLAMMTQFHFTTSKLQKTSGVPIWGNNPPSALLFDQMTGSQFSLLKVALTAVGVNLSCSS